MSDKEERSVNGDTALVTREDQPGFLGDLWQKARLVYHLLLDPEVPIYLKALPFAAFLYLLFPFDFLPDVIPGFGQLDDITILVVGAKLFIDMAPQHVVERYLHQMRQRGDISLDIDEQPPEQYFSDDPDVIEGIIIEEGDIASLAEDGEEKE